MKHFTLKKHLAALLLLLCGTVAMAHDFEVDGIYYNITDADACTVEVTYEGDNYDYSAEYVGSVTIPESVVYDGVTYSVTTIGDDAFHLCNGLTSVTIPNSVTTIGHDAFWACHGLTSITIPNSVTEIDGSAFGLCTGLTSITIPGSVTTIREDAFWGCNGLTSITIPGSVTTIVDGAFTNCSGLTSITIPNSVTTIGERAFDGCTGLTSITIQNSVTTIGDYVFRGCSGLTSVTIGNSVTTIGYEAFSDCTGITSVTIPGSVTNIRTWAFKGCTGLTSITISNGVTTIEQWAFEDCTGLTSITIPNSVTEIDGSAFSGCTGLTSIVVESGNTKFDSREGCNAIIETATNTLIAGCKNTVIPGSVTNIGTWAFKGCTGLTSITIPNSVTTIGQWAFEDCTGLTSITIPNSLTTIREDAFNNTGWWNNQPDGLIYKDGWLLGYKGDEPSRDIVIADGTKGIVYDNLLDFDRFIMLATTPPILCALYIKDVVLYVPIGTKELYENARGYSSSFSRIEDCIYNDGTEYSYDNIKEHTRIIYNREFPDTAWHAWYLPFDVPYSAVADELEVAYLNDVHQFDDDKDGNIDRTELEVILLTEGTIEANYPYVVRAKNAGNKKFDLPDVAIVPFEENYIDCSSVNVKYTFTGTHTAVNVFDAYSDGCYNIVNGEIVAPTEPEGQKQEDQVATTETEVTDLAQLENSKLYTIASARCLLLYSNISSLSDKLCTSSGSALGNVTRDINDLNQLFQIVKEGDAYYLYSVGAGKYINKDGNYTNSKSDALTLEYVGGTYPWKLCLGGNGMNSQESGQFANGIVVNGWTDTDAGNCYKIVEIGKQVIKGENPTAIEAGRWYLQMEARNSMTKLPSRIAIHVSGKEIGTTGIDEVESEGSFNGLPDTYYDLQGRIVEQPTRGIYIYNGKKLFVK